MLFRPTDESFEVADAMIRRNPEYLPDTSQVSNKQTDLFELVDAFWEGLQ